MYPVVEQGRNESHRTGQLLARADQKADGESDIDEVDLLVAAVSDSYDELALTDTDNDFAVLGVDVESTETG